MRVVKSSSSKILHGIQERNAVGESLSDFLDGQRYMLAGFRRVRFGNKQSNGSNPINTFQSNSKDTHRNDLCLLDPSTDGTRVCVTCLPKEIAVFHIFFSFLPLVQRIKVAVHTKQKDFQYVLPKLELLGHSTGTAASFCTELTLGGE